MKLEVNTASFSFNDDYGAGRQSSHSTRRFGGASVKVRLTIN